MSWRRRMLQRTSELVSSFPPLLLPFSPCSHGCRRKLCSRLYAMPVASKKSRLLTLARPQDELAAQMARFTDAMRLGHLGERVFNDVRQRYGALRDQLGDAIQPAAVTIDLRPQ